MKKEIAIIIPTRERPHKIQNLHKIWFELLDTSITTDCIIVLDEDNQHTYPRLDGFIYHIVNGSNIRGVTHPLNIVANRVCDDYEFIGFIGDDHIPRTKFWNKNVYDVLFKNTPLSMVYCNDLLQGKNLSTHIIMDSKFIKIMGFMGPTCFKHLFVDNFWMELGKTLENIHYLDNVVIEHLHYTTNKSPNDSLYSILNSRQYYLDGERTFKEYIESAEYSSVLRRLCHYKYGIH